MTKACISSPVGAILIDCHGTRLCSIRILASEDVVPEGYGDPLPGTTAAEAAHQLDSCFRSSSNRFSLPLAPAASARGDLLRAAIAAIPAGETMSYGALAQLTQSSPRAIGQACARNRFPIIIPCHRVVGSGGAIGHYSAGRGIITKTWLLDHERRGGLL